jgi:hypothetical protein
MWFGNRFLTDRLLAVGGDIGRDAYQWSTWSMSIDACTMEDKLPRYDKLQCYMDAKISNVGFAASL